MRDRQAREGTWDKWTVPLRLPGVPPKAAPAALNYLSCELPTQGKDLLENLDRPSASNAPDTLAALFALARTSKWDSQTHRAFIVQSSIDSYTETLGSPFEYQHEHPLARWARRLSSATRHDPNALRRATEAILDAFADGGLPPGAFGEWAKEMYEIDPTAPRRPWVLRLTLSADGLRFTSGMWIRADLARTPVAPSLHYDELADAWRTLAPPPGAERDQSLLILDVPLHAPSRLDQSTPPGGGRCLREDWRAVAYWPRKANGPLEAQSCPGRGHCRFRPKMPRAEHEHLQLLEGTNLAELSSRHDGHVLTVGAVEPEHFARGWRDANGYASTRDVFLRVRESVAAGKDALLIWTDKAYELLEPWEP